MSIVNTLALESNRQIKINFDGGDLSSDAGLLLIKEFISKLGIDTLLEKAFKTNDPVFKSVLEKDALASQKNKETALWSCRSSSGNACGSGNGKK